MIKPQSLHRFAEHVVLFVWLLQLWYQRYTSHNKNTKNDRITTHSIPLVIKTILHCFLGVWISLREGRVPVFNYRFSASSLCSALCELKLRILSALSAHLMLSRWHKCWLRAWLQPAPPQVYYREGKVSHRPFSASAERPDPPRWQDMTDRSRDRFREMGNMKVSRQRRGAGR